MTIAPGTQHLAPYLLRLEVIAHLPHDPVLLQLPGLFTGNETVLAQIQPDGMVLNHIRTIAIELLRRVVTMLPEMVHRPAVKAHVTFLRHLYPEQPVARAPVSLKAMVNTQRCRFTEDDGTGVGHHIACRQLLPD